VLESHVRLGLETNAGAEDVEQCRALLTKSIHDRRTGRSERGLQHVAQDAEDAMESRVLFGLGIALGGSTPLDTGHHLSNQDQIDDERRRQKGIFTDIEDADGLVTTHKDLSVVFVESTLVVSNGGHVLDDDAVIWVLTLGIELGVGSDHVVNNIGLGDFLGAELLLRAQIFAVVVTKMVVASN